MSGLGGVPVEEIVGPVQWQHSYHRCNCDDAAPQDPEAYMSWECGDSYRRGVLARQTRIMVLETTLASVRSQTFLEAAERIVTREPVDWLENVPVKLNTQQDMAGWLKSLAGTGVAE